MKLTGLQKIRKSNRAKLARLEKRGYIFSEETKNRIRTAKGRMSTSNMRSEVLGIVNDKEVFLHTKNLQKYYSGDKVQSKKLGIYLNKFDILLKADKRQARHLADFIAQGRISKKGGSLTPQQEQARMARLVDKDIPEYGSYEYFEWKYFKRNRRTIIDMGLRHNLPRELLEKMSQDSSVMYRFNTSGDNFFAEYYGDSEHPLLSDLNTKYLLNSIIGTDKLKAWGFDYATLLKEII